MTDTICDQLQSIADQLERLEQLEPSRLWKEEEAVLELLDQASPLVHSVLGADSYDGREISEHRRRYDVGLDGSTPYSFQSWVGSAVLRIRSAQRAIEVAAKRRAVPRASAHREAYVSPERIESLAAISSARFDYSKLAQLCRELNVAHEHECYYAVAMLVRAITDHVPPIFEVRVFSEVASNYGGSRSFRAHMNGLQQSLRHVADGFLHEQVRKKELAPTSQEVDFRSQVNSLLAEIIRVS